MKNRTEQNKIAVIIPCYNEEITIKKVISDFRAELPNAYIYVYDNNSSDNTFEIAKKHGAIVKKEFHRGKGCVVRSMFNDIEADIYIMVDGDDTYPACEVHNLLSVFKERNADLVVGNRLSNNSYHEKNKRPFHSFGNILVRKFINIIFKAKLNDIMSGYRVFSKRFVRNYPVIHEEFEIETDMTIFALSNKFNIEEVDINFRNRPEGSESKLNTFKDGFKVLVIIFNMFRFYRPLTFFSSVSLVFLAISVVIGYPVFEEYINYKYIYKIPSAILAVGLTLFSLLLFICGLILDSIANSERKQFEMNLKN